MKKVFPLIFTIIIAANSYTQQQIIITSNKENNYCNGTCTLLNIPELNNNPDAIIFVTALAKVPHPMAAYYVQSKRDTAQWSIMNLDNTQMQVGTQFSVEYYVQPDTTHFLHVITQQSLQNNGSYIDHVGLNDNPNAQIKFFQNLAPIARGGVANNYDLKIQYDIVVHRWYMFNTNNRQLSYGNGYNIAIAPGGNTVSTTVNNSTISNTGCNCIPYTAGMGLLLNGSTLSAKYSDPIWNARSLMGRDMSTSPPQPGQVLKWTGINWEPNYETIVNSATGWSLNGNTLTTNSGNVGIGTNSPQYSLDVKGNTKTNSLIIANGGDQSDFLIKKDASGLVSFRKGNVGLGLNYIIALQGVFPSQNPPIAQGTMVGEIKLFSGNTAPAGWAICNGQLLLVQQNQSLFNVIGTTYGGDGLTNFALPDLRNAVPVGAGLKWQLGERSN